LRRLGGIELGDLGGEGPLAAVGVFNAGGSDLLQATA